MIERSLSVNRGIKAMGGQLLLNGRCQLRKAWCGILQLIQRCRKTAEVMPGLWMGVPHDREPTGHPVWRHDDDALDRMALAECLAVSPQRGSGLARLGGKRRRPVRDKQHGQRCEWRRWGGRCSRGHGAWSIALEHHLIGKRPAALKYPHFKYLLSLHPFLHRRSRLRLPS